MLSRPETAPEHNLYPVGLESMTHVSESSRTKIEYTDHYSTTEHRA
jgi:hypothetical protein